MTPKEKAEELINRYLKVLAGGMYDVKEEAEKCALVCVDTILKDVGAKDWELDTATNTNYWQDVETELKNYYK